MDALCAISAPSSLTPPPHPHPLLLLLHLSAFHHPVKRRPPCQLAGCGSNLRDYCGASSKLSRAVCGCRAFLRPVTKVSVSHELWLLHRLLVCGWIPRGVAGYVRPGRAHRRLHGGRRGPDRCHGGRTARKSTASGQNVGVNCTAALFHQFLEFGPLILKPDFYLEAKNINGIRIQI